ncbi:MAG: MBL fold metallo-hydrolase [Acidothermales bacterium]|nr:MBL fold metallo-hydrolase [Acidothermales bacterium]
MLVAGFPAAAFGTNCYLLARAPGEECLVVDPGIDVVARLDELLEEHRLRPVAVLLTHGHIDHTFSVTPVCGARGVPAYVHPGDRAMLADPALGLSRDMRALLGGFEWSEPDDVRVMADGEPLRLAGLEITVDHAPGHTPGSVMFRLPEDGRDLCLSGDVLFAGSIGRTDLPGGDHATMLASLATKVLPLPDETVVLPGHGPRTTVGRERASNPFLADAAARSASAAATSPPGATSPASPFRGL